MAIIFWGRRLVGVTYFRVPTGRENLIRFKFVKALNWVNKSGKCREFHVFEGVENITQFIKTKSVILDHRPNQIVRKHPLLSNNLKRLRTISYKIGRECGPSSQGNGREFHSGKGVGTLLFQFGGAGLYCSQFLKTLYPYAS